MAVVVVVVRTQKIFHSYFYGQTSFIHTISPPARTCPITLRLLHCIMCAAKNYYRTNAIIIKPRPSLAYRTPNRTRFMEPMFLPDRTSLSHSQSRSYCSTRKLNHSFVFIFYSFFGSITLKKNPSSWFVPKSTFNIIYLLYIRRFVRTKKFRC